MTTAVASPVTEYADAVHAGRVVAGKWVKLACARHLSDLATGPARGLRFDERAAERAVAFFGFLHHSKGEWAGRAFDLGAWQKFVVGSLFGWQREYGRCQQCASWLPMGDGTIDCRVCFAPDDEEEQAPAETGWVQRFRIGYTEVARKNGKSTLAAGVGLLLAFYDDEPGAEVFCSATKRDQAKLIWGEAQRMVRSSPELRGDIKVLVGNLHSGNSKFMPLGADEDSTDGLNIHGNLVDELHAHKARTMWDVLITAMGSRRQPLTFVVTTAGSDRQSICWEQHEYGEQVLAGVIDDDSYFAYIAAIDEEDDWRDPECWPKANPNLGVSLKLEYLLTQCRQAEHSPAKQNTFQRLHCNRWTQQVDRWIDLDLWDANAGTVDEADLAGRECYGMLDLATVSDMTAWVMGFPSEVGRKFGSHICDDECLDIVARFWCPEAKLTDPPNRYPDQHRVWRDKGALSVTKGNATDFAFVQDKILKDAGAFQLVDMNVDRLFQAHQIAGTLADEGIKIFGLGMGFLGMAAPMAEFHRRLLGHKVHHGGNPILRWMADNVAVKQDPAGNLKPDKSTSQGKIDGIIGIVGVIDRVMRHETAPRSRYEDEGAGIVAV